LRNTLGGEHPRSPNQLLTHITGLLRRNAFVLCTRHRPPRSTCTSPSAVPAASVTSSAKPDRRASEARRKSARRGWVCCRRITTLPQCHAHALACTIACLPCLIHKRPETQELRGLHAHQDSDLTLACTSPMQAHPMHPHALIAACCSCSHLFDHIVQTICALVSHVPLHCGLNHAPLRPPTAVIP
jgi:hypothetical protein